MRADYAVAPGARGCQAPLRVRALMILWPAFLIAGVQEALVFVVVDPLGLQWFGTAPIDWPVQATYGITFFIFWATTATAGAITHLLWLPDRRR